MPNLFATEVAAGYAQVAVERGFDRHPDGLTYAIPRELASLQVGDRVIVPFGKGNRPTSGYVVERTSTTSVSDEQIKFVQKLDASDARLSAHLLELARWISSYYCSPIGMTLASMIPAAVKRN